MEKLTYEQTFIEAAIDTAMDFFNEKYIEEEGCHFFNPDLKYGGKERAKLKQEIISRMMQRNHSQPPTGDNVEVEIRVTGVENAIWHNRYFLGPLRKELICFALDGAMHEFTQDMAQVIQLGADEYKKQHNQC